MPGAIMVPVGTCQTYQTAKCASTMLLSMLSVTMDGISPEGS